jgi:hypothetical protein
MHSPSCAINNSRTSVSVNVPSTSISRARRIRDAIALAMRWFRASSSRRLNQYFCAWGACSRVLSRAHLERANKRATASLSVFAFSFGVGSRGGPLQNLDQRQFCVSWLRVLCQDPSSRDAPMVTKSAASPITLAEHTAVTIAAIAGLTVRVRLAVQAK